MNKELKEINFNKVIILDENIEKYDFNKYLSNGNLHKLKGFCHLCEDAGINLSKEKDENYKLLYMSHGASTDDFLQATDNENEDFSNWHKDGIMFLLESPSIDKKKNIYGETEYNGYNKRPSQRWYWVHKKQIAVKYPQEFKGGKYGELFNSLIFTFKLKNAYFTNLVKCGLNNQNDNYKGLAEYNYECIKTCAKEILTKEIDIVKPKIIFCFGSLVHKKFTEELFPSLKDITKVLPHPAGQKRGFKDEFYKHLYYSIILEGLYDERIVSMEEAKDMYKILLEKGKKI